MRIHEIEEALPGQVSILGKLGARFGIGGAAANALKILRDKAKIAYKQWLGAQAQMRAGGMNLDDKATFANAFGQYIARNFKLPTTDNIIKQAVDKINTAPEASINERFMVDLIVAMMSQYRTRNAGVTGQPAPAPTAKRLSKPKTKIRLGVAVSASDRQNYKLVRLRDGSTEWHDMGDNLAPDKIQRELNKKYEAE